MKYLGSKNRIAKYILPIMLEEANKHNITTWVEPFVGGGNMIDKVPDNFKRIGYDINSHTIQALKCVRDLVDELPNDVSLEHYNSLKGTEPNPITSLIRFGASFGGKFENGYARRDGKSMWGECVRNSKKQSPNLQTVELYHADFLDLNFKNSLIYCDPPYKGTTSYKTSPFPYEKFYDWCKKQKENGNIVFISEYEMSIEFKEVWQGEIKTNFASTRKKATHNATEKLFTL